MAIIARDSITLASINDVANARRYYKLQASTAPAPLVPTTNPPSGWATTEPTYVEGNTDTLYTVDLTVFSDGTFDYSPVSVSSSYEAAKVAYNKALAAQGTATNALTSANGRNQRVAGITDPPAGTTNALTGLPWRNGDTWVKWNNAANRHVIGQWTRDGTAWRAEAIESAFIANLDLNKLTVLGSSYMAQAVVDKIVGDAAYYKLFTADRIQLQAPGASVYYDGTFNDAGLSALRAANNATWTYNAAARSLTGTATFWLTYNGLDEALTTPLLVGQKYRLRVWGTGLVSGAKTFARRDNSGYVLLGGVTYSSGLMEVVFDVPNPGARVNLYAQSGASATITRVELVAMVGGTIIEPGGIDTPHLKSTAIDGMTVTGALVQSVTTANRGVKIDSNGLRAYDDSGNMTVQLAGSGGAIVGVTITGGTFQTDGWRVGPRVYIDSASGGRVLFQDANATELMALQSNTSGESEFRIRDYTGDTTTGQLRVRLRASDGLVFYSPAGVQQGRVLGEATRLYIVSDERIAVRAKYLTLGFDANAASEVQIDGNSRVLLSQGSVGRLSMDGGGIYHTGTLHQFTLSNASSGYGSWIFRPIALGGVTRSMLAYAGGNMATSAGAANLYMHSDGIIYKSTSSRRHKVDIRDITVDPYRVLGVPVRDFYDRTSVESLADYMEGDDPEAYVIEGKFRRIPGVVAEEVEDAGLGQFVTYNEDGDTSGVLYDRLTLLLIPVVRDLRARLERLENQA